MKDSTRIRHDLGIDRVVARLQQCLAEGLPLPDVAELAALAHQSPFHFQRVYRALTGESIGRTVVRLRLLRALQLLERPGASVTEAALGAGYATPQALARAFRQELDASPSALRSRPALLQAERTRLSQPPPLAADEAPLQVTVTTLEPLQVLALRKRGPFEELDGAFGRLFEWAAGQGLVERLRQLVGIPLDDHRDVPPPRFAFDCAMAFDAALPVPPAPMRVLRLDGGRYAVLRHVGSYLQLEAATDRLLARWLPGSGHALRDAPIHYHYLDDPEEVPESILRADIRVPLR